MQKEWFSDWFNSPYYHILYGERDDKEAQKFIDNLCHYLNPLPKTRILDIACGKGRHSIYLNKKGFDVVGIDLSYASIKYAKQYENDSLQFFVHDMRHLFYTHYFDLVLNLFTSFGYFETNQQHIKALKSFSRSLKKDGYFIIDFLNSEKVKKNLVSYEQKTIGNIQFTIHRKIENQKIIKEINFYADGKNYYFKEEVSDFNLANFEGLFNAAGLEICHTFGDYDLNNFDVEHSDRLIIVCKNK